MILEAVFPTRCAGCGADGSWCCAACLSAIEIVTGNPCAGCGSLKRDHECRAVGGALDGLAAVGFYHDPRLRALVHGLKYSNATCLLPTFRTLLARYKAERRDPWPWAGTRSIAIQHVPGAPNRIRARGFDQAEFLRGIVKEELVPWASDASLLRRKKTTKVQADLEAGPLREANVADSFRFSPESISPENIGSGSNLPKMAIWPKRGGLESEFRVPPAVILVDDVFTTGATMRAAARILKSNGVKRVYGFAFALGA